MRDKCGRSMEGKKRVVPGEACAERPERGNRGHIKKATLNAEESAEAIVPGMGRAEVMQPE